MPAGWNRQDLRASLHYCEVCRALTCHSLPEQSHPTSSNRQNKDYVILCVCVCVAGGGGGRDCSRRKISRQGLNLDHSYNHSHSSDAAGSLTL